MALERLRHRQALLAAQADETALTTLALAVADAAAALPKDVPDGLRAALEEALLYALVRHRPWVDAPILADVLVDFLIQDFRVDRAAATAFAQAGLAAAREQSRVATHVPATDKEFLRYVFINTAAAGDEATLALDLGLGAGLIRRIRQAVEVIVAIHDAETTAPLMFLPELDAQISDIMCELAKEQQTTPWAVSVHRLRYLLVGAPEPLSSALAQHGAKWLHDLLLAMGARGSLSVRQIKEKLGRVLPQATPDAAALMAALHDFDLVYPTTAASARDADGARWQAAAEALELTADAYARNVVNTAKEPLAGLAPLNAHYQAAIIRALPQPDVETLRRVLLVTRPLAPAALTAALCRLRTTGGAEIAQAAAAIVVKEDASPWLRKAACQFLAAAPGAAEVGQTLAEVARSDASPAVRAAALQALRRPDSAARFSASRSDASHEPHA